MCTLQVQEQVAEVEAAGQTLRSVQHIRKATTRRPDAVLRACTFLNGKER